MDTNYLPNEIKKEINTYNQTHHTWLAMKIFQMGTCAAALLGTLAVDKDNQDVTLGISLASGLSAYAIHKREENKKRSIENNIKHFNHFQQMTWQEKENYFYAGKSIQKKEKESVKMMGAGLACFMVGQPVLGSILAVGGLLHSTTARDFIQEQERILNKYTPRPWEIQKER
ncbi:MAG: hypothetical protein IKV03_02485 [Alphaproteobacteria bacterium]|nr:hypothetical protein [Alphaproteobacteria bacterium]